MPDKVKETADAVIAEIRSLNDKIVAKEKALDEEKRALDAKEATYTDRNPGMIKGDAPSASFRDIVSAITEKRALTVNGTGAISVIPQIVKEFVSKLSLTSKYRYFYGANAQTVIPVLSPLPATPAGQSEGATNVSSDSTAVLASKNLLPKAYVSVLPVSAEALIMSGADIEGQLSSVFSDVFGKAILVGSLTGDGTGNNMTGMFLDASLTNNVSCAATGTPKLLDLAKLALTAQDYADDAVIVINPSLIAAMLAETTAESAPIKQELMINRSCMGVPVIMTGSAPSTLTAGSVVAVAMPMSNYAVAIANQLTITPIQKVGDTNTYFQATMFLNGSPIVAKNGWQLVTI